MAGLIGAEKIYRELKKLPKKVQGRRLDEAVRLGAQIVADQAVTNSFKFYVTGRLTKAIDTRKNSRKSTVENSVYDVGYRKGSSRDDESGAYYGGFVELGTRLQPPQPYLRPSIEQKADAAAEIIAKRLARALGLR